ncbi:MAG: FkbM family methyltransferase, partial [Myxococcota bacterium]
MGDRELHPPSWRYRLVRRTRRYRDTRGWGRLADFVAARGMSGRFRVANGSFIHEGDVSDLIDRELYLRGGYEDQKISLFLSRVPSDRRTSILDVGANVGTHTLPFARTFAQVHAFEPNPEVVRKLRQNVALNDNLNVAIHPCGLSDERAERTFYSVPSKHNPGLGTFSSVEQYDVPLDAVDRLEVVEGDGYLESLGVERVDAIKVDVQGYEHRV